VEYTEGRLEPQTVWSPVIQSYDYGAPISEAGDYGQPGIGPPPDGPANRYMVRKAKWLVPNPTLVH
jgi:beta-galactosidase